jgi:transcriptional regulator with XRE-family HTH domain
MNYEYQLKRKYMNAEELINKLMDYYNVETITELSSKLNVGQPTISKWKKNNSYNIILKKCKKLNILEYIDIDRDINKYEDVIINSIKYRIIQKVFNESNYFQQEIILLLNCLKENKDIEIETRDEIIDLLKKYNIKLILERLQHIIVEKHRNNVIAFLYSFDDIEITYICKNIGNFIDILRDNIKFYNKFFSFDKK